MKRVLLVLGSLILASVVFADPVVKTVPLASRTMGTYVVSVSSFAASTQLRPANADRTGITITNYGGQIVFISSYSASATTNMFPLAANNTVGDEFRDYNNPYNGIWYALTIAGQAANDVRIIEFTK